MDLRPPWRSWLATAASSHPPCRCSSTRCSTTALGRARTDGHGSCGPNATTSLRGSGTSAGPIRLIAAPARRNDLTGLPPAWIGVGTLDLFYEESTAYAERLRDAGVPVHLEVARGAFHAFDFIAPKASVSQRFFASQCRSLRAALVDSAQ